MTTTELEKELIELAKQNPTGDYYVGSVGESLRNILKRWMGERYPEKEIDPPRKPEKRPTDPIEAMLWDESERIMEKAARRIAQGSPPWIRLLGQAKLPEGLGTCLELKTVKE